MKRNVFLSMVMLLISAMLCSSAAFAEFSASRDMMTAEEINIPLVEVPTTMVEAEVQADENGAATVTVASGDLLNAVNTVNDEGIVRITVTAAGTEGAERVTAVQPKEALQAVVDQTNAELCIESAVGQVTLLNAVLRSVVDTAEDDDVSIAVSTRPSVHGQPLLDSKVDAAAAQIASTSVAEVSITSGNTAITELNGGFVTVSLPVGDTFQEGMRYKVYQAGANGGAQTLEGWCVMVNGQLRVEFESGGPGIFIVLPDAIGGDAATESTHMVASPLASRAVAEAGAPALFASMQQWRSTALKQLLHLLGV